jgi:hypothetical protein
LRILIGIDFTGNYGFRCTALPAFTLKIVAVVCQSGSARSTELEAAVW